MPKKLNLILKFRYEQPISSRDMVLLSDLMDIFLQTYKHIFKHMGLKISCSLVSEPYEENPFSFVSQEEFYQEGDEFD